MILNIASIFVLWGYSPTRAQVDSLRFLDHTQLGHTHTRQDSSQRVISPLQRPLATQHTTNRRDEHPCPSGIRTRDPSHQAAADRGLRPYGHSGGQSLKCPCFQADVILLRSNFRMRFCTFNTSSHDAPLQTGTRKVPGLNLVRDNGHPNFLS
jgi:hypothetical protein